MRSLCQKKMLNPCSLFLGLLLCCLFVVSYSLDANASTGSWSSTLHAVYSSYSSTIHIDNTDDFSDYNHYHGCTTTSVDLFANNFYGSGVSQLYNVHISSRHPNNDDCLHGAGGTFGDSSSPYNQFLIKTSINGYTKNFGSSFYPVGFIYGSGGTTSKLACSALPANVAKSKYVISCYGNLSDNEILADYDIWFRTNDMFSGYPIYTMVDPSNDQNSNTRPTLSADVSISWESANTPFDSPTSTLNDYNDALMKQRQTEKEELYNDSQDAGRTIGDVIADVIMSKSSLLQVFTDFVNSVNSAVDNPGTCNIDFDLFSTNAYGRGASAQVYNVDLCSLNPPSVISSIGTIVVMGFCTLLSFFSVRTMLGLLRRIQ